MINEFKKLVIVDFSVLMHKAIFAFFSTQEQPATYLFSIMLLSNLKILGVNSNDLVVFAMDYGSWRKKKSDTYKQNREALRSETESPENWKILYEEFNEFLPILKESTPFWYIKQYEKEADDIASVLVRKLGNNFSDIIMVTTDMDWAQLCSFPNVKMYSPGSKKFKIIKNPEMILNSKIYQGDKSDNLAPLINPTEEEVRLRKEIVDLSELPDYIEAPLVEEINKIGYKGYIWSKFPYFSVRQGLMNLYKN